MYAADKEHLNFLIMHVNTYNSSTKDLLISQHEINFLVVSLPSWAITIKKKLLFTGVCLSIYSENHLVTSKLIIVNVFCVGFFFFSSYSENDS